MSKKTKKLNAKVKKLNATIVAHKDTINILDCGLKSTRDRLKIAENDLDARQLIIGFRDSTIETMKNQHVKNHKEFQRLLRDYKRSLQLINSLTDKLNIDEG